jgi:NAD(P)-dependent dehydrogenase (short-subunit alcohol dehydrogenase family)
LNAILLGSRSDIGKALASELIADGWSLEGWARGDPLPRSRFDLCLIAIGAIAPVGVWHEQQDLGWERCIQSNLIVPINLLRAIWPQHNSRCAVCFLAGSNPNTIMDGYSAYNCSKMALLKAVEQLDHETPDARFFALGPGTVLTKIHKASEGWPNPKLEAARKENKSTPIERIYECLMWAIKQPKEVIGGRNICVSDPWDTGGFLAETLKRNPDLYKLRRAEP